MDDETSSKDPMAGVAKTYLIPLVIGFAALAAALGLLGDVAWKDVIADGAIAALAGYVALVFQDAVPERYKIGLVFWDSREATPGHRFDKLQDEFDRYATADVEDLIPTGASTPAALNKLWNGWLGECRMEPRVLGAHRRYIGTRDAAVLAAVLTGLAVLMGLWPSVSWEKSLKLAAAFLVAYLILMVAARNSANRLVTNVVAWKIDSATPRRTTRRAAA